MILHNFIAIEGIDGSGKSTQAKLLVDTLNGQGKSAILTTEPTTLKTGVFLRKVLSGDIKVDPRTVAYLFAADRCEHILGKNGVEELCNKGNIVISDRYLFSSLAYQSITAGDKLPKLLNSPFPLPQILIYIKISVETGLKRITERSENKEIFEKREFQEKLLAQYKNIINEYCNNDIASLNEAAKIEDTNTHNMKIVIIDGEKNKEEVARDILQSITPNI